MPSAGNHTPQDDPIGFQILRAIRRILRRTLEHSRTVGRQGGISVPQMLCLKAIAECSPGSQVTVAMVAETVQLSAPTVSRILDRLEKNGFIKRQRGRGDRRKVSLSLTATGRDRLQSLPAPLHEQFLERLATLEESRRLGLLTSLEQIVDLMDAADLDASPMLSTELEPGPNGETADTNSPPSSGQRMSRSSDQNS